MDRLVATNSVVLAGADTPPATGTPQYATSGNPATATPATVLPAYAFNAIQEELIAIIVGGGITPSRFAAGQVLSAIQAISKQSNILIDSGVANAYIAANSTPLTSATLVHGVRQSVQFLHANTAASTYAPDGLVVKPIYGLGLSALQGGEIALNSVANMIYIVNAAVNGGNGAWVILECTGGALQVIAGAQSNHAAQIAQVQDSTFTSAISAGVADAITASFSPAITTLAYGVLALSIRASFANVTTTPTFTPNPGVITAYTIVKGNNQPLVAGDIAGAGHWIELQWDATLSKWVLLNPASGIGITPPALDNSTKNATTAWVKGQGESFSAITGLATTQSLSISALGQLLVVVTGGTTQTLPPVATAPAGSVMSFMSVAGISATTLKANAAENIYSIYGTNNAFTMNAGESVQFVSNGVSWYVGSYFSSVCLTQPKFTSSTYLANTAYVQNALGNFSGVVSSQTAVVLTAANAGNLCYFWGTTAATYTLPSANTLPLASSTFTFANDGPAILTVARAGTDTVLGGASLMYVYPGDTLIVSTATAAGTQWIVTGGTASAPYSHSMINYAGAVGSVRNAKMSVSAAGVSAAFTADEITAETALGGWPVKLSSYNQTINLATTGAGGMDVGTAPVSGYVALYAIYNPTTNTASILATNATASAAGNVYSGANMPAGYTYSALIGVWPTTASSQFVVGYQIDRTFWFVGVQILNTSANVSTPVSLSVASAVPLNAKSCAGYATTTNSTATDGSIFGIYGSSSQIGLQLVSATASIANAGVAVAFPDVPLITPQTLYYVSYPSPAGTCTSVVTLTKYTF